MLVVAISHRATAQETNIPLAAADPSDTTETAASTASSAEAAEPSPDLFDALTISGQVRHRSELDRKSAAEPPSLHLLRTRLNVAFQPAADVKAFVQIQDARTFGNGNPAAGRGTLDGQAPALDLHQAYFAVSNLFGSNLNLKVGRQELAYGNQRLIGSVGWSNVGRTFDAGVLSYASDKAKVDVLAARLVDDRATSQNLLGVYSTWSLGAPSLELFALYDDNDAEIAAGPDAGESALNRATVGTTLRGKASAFDYEVEAAYQFGKTAAGDAARSSIAAYLVSVAAGMKAGKGRIGAMYTILSGDNNATDDEATTFNTLFATNHKFYGFLDFFPFNATFRPGGLHNAVLQLSHPLSSRMGAKLDVHHFQLSEDLGEGTALGQEVDLTVNVKYNDAFSIVGGASVFVASDQAEAVFGTSTSTWFFLGTTVNF